MKPLVYTQIAPAVVGMYWHLAEIGGDPTVVRVFEDIDGYWSVQYDNLHLPPGTAWSDDALGDGFDGGIDFIENWRKGFWAGPIPVPKAPKSPDSVNLS